MTQPVSLTDITALTGAVVAVAALVLSIINYRRENPRVVVKLFWDWGVTDNPRYDPKKLWGFVEVSNVGRRPIYIRNASLKLPKGYEHTHELLLDSVQGQRLAEGDPPAQFMMSQDGMQKYAKDWRRIRAVVYDTAGRRYVSKRLDKGKRPSWAFWE
jgi:hypothetical protein